MNAKPKARVAILGCGNPARKWHLPTLSELAKRGEIEFAGICEMDAKLGAEMAAQYEVPHYLSLEEMLDRDRNIQVVDVVTADPLHHVLACQVAEAGRHVIVEKPMALTLPACDAIIDACRRNSVHFEVAENYFRMPKQRMILKLIDEGVLGDIVRVYFMEPKRELPFEPAVTHGTLGRPISGFGKTGGMCMDMGAHRLSQLRLYAGSQPVQIAGTVRKYRADPSILAEDWAHAVIDFESGALGIYETSRVGELQKYCQITGTLGGILDKDTFGEALPLRLLDGETWRDVLVTTERRNIDGVNVVVEHAHSPIENKGIDTGGERFKLLNVLDPKFRPENYKKADGAPLRLFDAAGVKVDLSKRSHEDMGFWHRNVDYNEVIFCFRGALRWETEMGTVILKEGDMMVIPKGITHRSALCEDSAEENILLELKVRDELVYVGDDQ